MSKPEYEVEVHSNVDFSPKKKKPVREDETVDFGAIGRTDFLDIARVLENLHKKKDTHYRGSWKKRGDLGVLYTIARKWDRMESTIMNAAKTGKLDDSSNILSTVMHTDENLFETVGDLATYCLMWLEWLRERFPSLWIDYEKRVERFK
jgi:hypothetical protein